MKDKDAPMSEDIIPISPSQVMLASGLKAKALWPMHLSHH